MKDRAQLASAAVVVLLAASSFPVSNACPRFYPDGVRSADLDETAEKLEILWSGTADERRKIADYAHVSFGPFEGTSKGTNGIASGGRCNRSGCGWVPRRTTGSPRACCGASRISGPLCWIRCSGRRWTCPATARTSASMSPNWPEAVARPALRRIQDVLGEKFAPAWNELDDAGIAEVG